MTTESEALAQAVFQENGIMYVVCPHCFCLHQHGDAGMVDVSGNHRAAHCGLGSYRVKGMFDFRLASQLLNRREVDIRRKREGRAAAARAGATAQAPLNKIEATASAAAAPELKLKPGDPGAPDT